MSKLNLWRLESKGLWWILQPFCVFWLQIRIAPLNPGSNSVTRMPPGLSFVCMSPAADQQLPLPVLPLRAGDLRGFGWTWMERSLFVVFSEQSWILLSHLYLPLGWKTELSSRTLGTHCLLCCFLRGLGQIRWIACAAVPCLVKGRQRSSLSTRAGSLPLSSYSRNCLRMHSCRIRIASFSFAVGLVDVSKLWMAGR